MNFRKIAAVAYAQVFKRKIIHCVETKKKSWNSWNYLCLDFICVALGYYKIADHRPTSQMPINKQKANGSAANWVIDYSDQISQKWAIA